MSSDRSIAHAFSQRKIMLDNSADCLASYRDSIRSNMNIVRKEITDTFSQQVAILRARETELLRHLEVEVNVREAQLDSQQKELLKLIKQCDSAQETVRREGRHAVGDTLNCLSHMDFTPKGCGTIHFDKDLVEFRTAIGNFGRIRYEKNNDLKTTGETLPMSMEDYEDDFGMTHKSVQMVSLKPKVTTSPEQMENIRKWLSYIPGRDLTHEEIFKLVPEDRTDSEAETNSICSSFDVIQSVPQEPIKANTFNIEWPILCPKAPKKEEPIEHAYEFTNEFLKTLNSDAAGWLIGQGTPSNSKQSLPETATSSAHKYEFQTVMQNIRDSNMDNWYLPSCSKESEPSASAAEEEDKMEEIPTTPRREMPEIDEALAKNLEMLAIFSIHSGCDVGKGNLPVTSRDIDAASSGDQAAKKKLIAFGHHLWTIMHN